MKIKKYFVYTTWGDFFFYDTEEEAKAAAQESLAEARKNSIEEGYWCDEIEDLFWGEVRQSLAEIKGEVVTDYGDTNTEFEFVDVGDNPLNDAGILCLRYNLDRKDN